MGRFSRTSVLILTAMLSTQLVASPFVLSYGGRLANDAGEAVSGPVTLEFKFYNVASGGTSIGVSTVRRNDVPLEDGVFQIDITEFTLPDYHMVTNTTSGVWIEVKDVGNNKTYPRQRFTAVPFALKVPVDGKTIQFGSDGRLKVGPNTARAANQFLATDANGNLIWEEPATPTPSNTLGGHPVSSTTPTNDQVLTYSGGSWGPSTLSIVGVPAGGTSGQFLQRDGSTGLLWVTPGGGGLADGDVTEAKIAAGAVTTAKIAAESVTSAKISSGTIVDSNISPSAGIASSKISGLSTAATTPVGTAANNLVQLDGAGRLPAVDGSLLTNISGADWSAPGAIGSATPNSGVFTTINANSGAFSNVIANSEMKLKDSPSGNYTILKSSSLGTNVTYTLPAAPSANMFLKTDAAGVLSWATADGGNATNASSLNNQPASFYQNAGNLNSGFIPSARLNFGTTVGTVTAGDDSRLSDSRMPTGPAGGDLTGTYPNPQIASDTITSTHILDGTIQNIDIAAGAAIDDSKLATIVTPGKVSGNAINTGVIGGNTEISTTGNISSPNITADLVTATTMSATATLEVSSSAHLKLPDSGTASTPSLRWANGLGINGSINDDIKFVTGYTERLTINNNGNVGIGTNVPNEKLVVVGNSKFGGAVFNKVRVLSSNADTINSEDYIVVFSGFTTAETFLLPSCSSAIEGRTLVIINKGSSATLTINGNFAASALSLANYITKTVVCDGSHWHHF